ncbi:MAG: hypothetical protein GF409_05605 [Candidatus Omnitrophica bacterium]|nr:hypothetical protein [Candidatus Omnitrophota bacterium]
MFSGKRFFVLILTILVIWAVTAEALMDTEEGWLPQKPEWMPDISHSHSFLTKYIWRGWNLGDDPVWQMDTSVSKWGLTFDIWTNYTFDSDKSDDNGLYQEFTEVDYTVDYTINMEQLSGVSGMDFPEVILPLSVSGGYVYYTFPNLDRDDKFFDTHEVYLGASYDCFLQPSFIWYWDVGVGKGNTDGGGDGSYFQFGLGHTFELAENGLSATIGWTTGIIDEQWTDETGWADMVFSGEVAIPIFNYFTITPSIAYSLILDRDTYNDDAENEFYGGITIGFDY